MTLTIGIIAKDGIVLASDSRASNRYTANDTVQKLFKLDDHHALGIAGDGSLAKFFFDSISNDFDFTLGITALAEQLRRLGKEKFDEYFSHQAPDKRPTLVILLAGYTTAPDSLPKIYQLNSNDNFVPRESTTGFNCVGVAIIADYLLNRLYEKEITTKQAISMATFCIKETGSQDNTVGGLTQVAEFSNVMKYDLKSKEEISEIEKKCEQFHALDKNKFYPEDETSGSTISDDAVKQ